MNLKNFEFIGKRIWFAPLFFMRRDVLHRKSRKYKLLANQKSTLTMLTFNGIIGCHLSHSNSSSKLLSTFKEFRNLLFYAYLATCRYRQSSLTGVFGSQIWGKNTKLWSIFRKWPHMKHTFDYKFGIFEPTIRTR